MNGIMYHIVISYWLDLYISCVAFLVLSKWFRIYSLAIGSCIWQCGPATIWQSCCRPVRPSYQAAKLTLQAPVS